MKKKYKQLPLRLDEEMYETVRQLAHISRKPMAEIIREGIDLRLKGIKKVLTNEDIAI